MDAWKNPANSLHLRNYPPLYSVQDESNKESQYRVWADILVACALRDKLWTISLQEFSMFSNSQINREAPMSLRQDIVDFLVKNGRAFWIGSSQRSQAFILRKSVVEYTDLIYNSLVSMGVTNPIQAHELIEDIDYNEQEYYGMPEELMECLLKELVKRRKMASFKANNDNNYKLIMTPG